MRLHSSRLDHVIVFEEAGLRRILKGYFQYYENLRTHAQKSAPARLSDRASGD
jgi:hypothetical protein